MDSTKPPRGPLVTSSHLFLRTCLSQGHTREAQPHSPLWPDSSTSMPDSQPSKIMSSLRKWGPCGSLGGTHYLLPLQVHEGSVFSFLMHSKALPALRHRCHLFKELWLLQSRVLSSINCFAPCKKPRGRGIGRARLLAWSTGIGEKRKSQKKKSKMHSYVKNRSCHKHTPKSCNRL